VARITCESAGTGVADPGPTVATRNKHPGPTQSTTLRKTGLTRFLVPITTDAASNCEFNRAVVIAMSWLPYPG